MVWIYVNQSIKSIEKWILTTDLPTLRLNYQLMAARITYKWILGWRDSVKYYPKIPFWSTIHLYMIWPWSLGVSKIWLFFLNLANHFFPSKCCKYVELLLFGPVFIYLHRIFYVVIYLGPSLHKLMMSIVHHIILGFLKA